MKIFFAFFHTFLHKPLDFSTYPPKDYRKWANICAHIIRHYNEGWANGFHHGIQYWEIWNEPDCRNRDGSNPCWQGTAEQFVDFLATVAPILKQQFPTLSIGGPALCSPWSEEGRHILNMMGERKIALDFISYHWYGRNMKDLNDSIYAMQQLMADSGYAGVPAILNEWNYIKGWADDLWRYSLAMEKGKKGAAFAAGAMCVAQAGPLDMLMYYDARPCGMNGLFNTDTLAPLPTFGAYALFREIADLGEWIPTTQDYENGLYTVAATNSKGKKALFLSTFTDDDTTAPKDWHLHLQNASKTGMVKVKFYGIGEDNRPAFLREEVVNGQDFTLSLTLPCCEVMLLTLEEVSGS